MGVYYYGVTIFGRISEAHLANLFEILDWVEAVMNKISGVTSRLARLVPFRTILTPK